MTATSQCPASVFPGLFDSLFIESPLPYIDQLRTASPVFHDEASDLWLLTRHADIRSALADADTFAPDNALEAVVPVSAQALRVLARSGFILPKTLANNGLPSHRSYRRTVAAFFSPKQVRAAEPLIRRL